MAAARPTKIGKYDVVDVIGRGGMGIVYKGMDPHLGRSVAIKMMTAGFDDNPDLLKRFFREAQSTASLQHPNIVTVYELGDYGGNPYLVMEYLEGESLDSMITSRRQLDLVEKLDIMINVCHGLSYAHQRNIVHRDIKPANIMAQKHGGIKIVDFGIAHIGDKNVTRPGQVMGSFSYMSPEQINSKPVDARTDIFSTGVVLYQLLTYILPFEGESTAATLLKIIHEPPPPLANFLNVYPPELESILLRALAKDREERYSSAEEMAIDLAQVQGELRQDLVGQHFREASILLERNDLHKAKEEVLRVLKIDRQHSRAPHLLREIQQRIQREEVAEQVRQLRAQADDAYSQGQFDAALEHIDRALTIERNNLELQRFRESIQVALARTQKLRDALTLAESSHKRGELDSAKRAIDEALELAPDDAHAKALYRTIHKEWVERSRQRQLENYLSDARREIGLRRYTSALEILKNAEPLDPNSPQLRALIDSAAAGRDQERKRKELELLNREVEDALSRDDYQTAMSKMEAGLARFPEDAGLIKLRDAAEKKRQAAERKQFVDEQLASARKLLEQGLGEELVALLEEALRKVGTEPRLESLLAIVRENVEREKLEKRKTDYLQRAKDSLRRKAYAEAIGTLETARREFKGDPEFDSLLRFSRDEATAEKRRETIIATSEKSRKLAAQHDYESAIKLLEATLLEIPDEDLQMILAETRNAAANHESKLREVLDSSEKLLQARKPDEARQLLESEGTNFSTNPGWQKLLSNARHESQRLSSIEQAIQESRALLGENQFDDARRRVEQCRKAYGTTPELEQHAMEIEQQRSLACSKEIESALSDARTLVMGADYHAALDRLSAVSQFVPHVSASLQAVFQAARKEAAAAIAQQLRSEVEQHIAAGELTKAQEVLQRTRTNFPSLGSLSSLEVVVGEEVKRKGEAVRILEEARRKLAKADWKSATELLEKAFGLAIHAPQVRTQVIREFFNAAESALNSDWRLCEEILRRFGKLEPAYAIPTHLLTGMAERQREEVVTRCLKTAQRLQSDRDLPGALREVSRGLATYPNESRMKNLARDLQDAIRQDEEKVQHEQERRSREAFVQTAMQSAEREADLVRRIEVLENALAKYPAETKLQRHLDDVRELHKRVETYVEAARAEEAKKQYDQCLKQWQMLRATYPQYPQLESNMRRVIALQDQAHSADRMARIEQLRKNLAAADFERVSNLLVLAEREFPGDREFSDIERRLEEGLKLRNKAQKLLGGAQQYFKKQRWDKGAAELKRACVMASNDPVVRDQALGELLQTIDAMNGQDWQSAERLASFASEIYSASPVLTALRTKIDTRKQEQVVAQYLAGSRKLLQARDPKAALRELENGLLAYPTDMRLSQLKAEIEAQLRQEEVEAQRRQQAEQEKTRQLALQKQLELEERHKQEPEEKTTGKQTQLEKPPVQRSAATRLFDNHVTGPGGRTQWTSFLDVSGWDEDTLKIVEKQLATFIGPVARIIVKKAASKTTDPGELYSLLVSNLEGKKDRETFLAGKAEVIHRAAKTPPPQASAEVKDHAPNDSVASAEITPAAVARATHALVPYIGPISGVLAKKAAVHADSLRAFYLLLAEHIDSQDERNRFLKDSGYPATEG